MKRELLKYIVLGGLAISLPVLAAPAFVGPSKAPPAGNVEGVIWNLPPGSPPQTANINISGNVNTNDVNLSNNIFVAPTKNLIVTSPISGAVNDYYIVPQSTAPLSGLNLNVQGSLLVKRPTGYVGPSILGKDGRVQALKFCFDDGGAGDCITAWPLGGGGGGGSPSPGGDFVFRGGDSMTGTLTISTSTFGIKGLDIDTPGGSQIGNGSRYVKIGQTLSTLEVENGENASAMKILQSNTGANAYGIEVIMPSSANAAGIRIGSPTSDSKKGLEAYSDQRAIYGNSISAMGGEFVGETYGVDAKTRTTAVGTAVRGSNGAAGGDFSGTVTGIVANGGSSGSYFTNGTGQYTYLAYPGYGIYSDVGGASNYGMFTNGEIYTSANVNAPNNTVESCSWTGYVPDGTDLTCPSTQFVNGMTRSGGSMRLYCCNL